MKTTDPKPVSLIALSGSLRTPSHTRAALAVAIAAAEAAGASVAVVDIGALPFCDGRDDPSTYPAEVAALREAVAGADGLLIATPEYHNSCSGVIKNALDLLSSKQIAGKVCGLLSVSGGAMAMSSLSHLRIVLRAVHAWTIPQQAMVPSAWKHFDAEGKLTDDGLRARIEEVGRLTAEYAQTLRSTRS